MTQYALEAERHWQNGFARHQLEEINTELLRCGAIQSYLGAVALDESIAFQDKPNAKVEAAFLPHKERNGHVWGNYFLKRVDLETGEEIFGGSRSDVDLMIGVGRIGTSFIHHPKAPFTQSQFSLISQQAFQLELLNIFPISSK